MYALIDADNFYVSVQQDMNPALRGKPVVVAGSNDGCVISRSEEAKALGVKMGQPVFQLQYLIQFRGLIVLSANFELLGDVSDRMMSLAAGLGPIQHIYSIDECFIGGLDGVRDLTKRAWAIRERIKRCIGISCGLGLAPGLLLAKLCNHVAKSSWRKPGSYPAHLQRVCNWQELSAAEQVDILRRTMAGDVWGIGRRLAAQLAEHGFITALDVSRMPLGLARKEWGVVMERMVLELQGISCIPMELAPPPKKQIACTRSFGHAITQIEPLLEAVSEFAARAAEKLRGQQLRAGAISVFAHTSPFRPGPRFSKSASVMLQPPSADTQVLVNAAIKAVHSFYEPGYRLSKAGVMLLDLGSNAVEQLDLMPESLPIKDQSSLMEAMDRVNARFGKGTLRVGSAGWEHQDDAGWRMRQESRSPRYTTRLDEALIVRA